MSTFALELPPRYRRGTRYRPDPWIRFKPLSVEAQRPKSALKLGDLPLRAAVSLQARALDEPGTWYGKGAKLAASGAYHKFIGGNGALPNPFVPQAHHDHTIEHQKARP